MNLTLNGQPKDQLILLTEYTKGYLCVVYFGGKLLRARLMNYTEKSACVRLIDSGKQCCIDCKYIYQCPKDLFSIPPKARRFFLPVHMSSQDGMRAATILTRVAFKTVCKYVVINDLIKNDHREGIEFCLIASPETGSFIKFFEGKMLAIPFSENELLVSETLQILDEKVSEDKVPPEEEDEYSA